MTPTDRHVGKRLISMPLNHSRMRRQLSHVCQAKRHALWDTWSHFTITCCECVHLLLLELSRMLQQACRVVTACGRHQRREHAGIGEHFVLSQRTQALIRLAFTRSYRALPLHVGGRIELTKAYLLACLHMPRLDWWRHEWLDARTDVVGCGWPRGQPICLCLLADRCLRTAPSFTICVARACLVFSSCVSWTSSCCAKRIVFPGAGLGAKWNPRWETICKKDTARKIKLLDNKLIVSRFNAFSPCMGLQVLRSPHWTLVTLLLCNAAALEVSIKEHAQCILYINTLSALTMFGTCRLCQFSWTNCWALCCPSYCQSQQSCLLVRASRLSINAWLHNVETIVAVLSWKPLRKT